MLEKNTPWEEVIRELTALPTPEMQKEYGDENFFRAGKFRKNARRLWEERILPLFDANGGKPLAVLSGFMDAGIRAEAGMEADPVAASFRGCALTDTREDYVLELEEEAP